MTYLESLLLGSVQGITEFLPISSSAHLVILPWAFHFKDPGLTFDVALHFGTLLSIILYFSNDWINIFKGAYHYKFRSQKSHDDQKSYRSYVLLWLIIIATIPAALIGFLLEDLAETTLRHPLLVAVNMSLLGLLLIVVERMGKKARDLAQINLKDSIIIGISQALALIPGVSRSGITMTAGLWRGFDRVSAARFSFLLATPIMFGACVLKLKDFFEADITGPIIAGIISSALAGFLAIKYLLKYVSNHSFKIFVYYRFVFTIVVLIVYWLR